VKTKRTKKIESKREYCADETNLVDEEMHMLIVRDKIYSSCVTGLCFKSRPHRISRIYYNIFSPFWFLSFPTH